MLPVSFHIPGVSAGAANADQGKSPKPKKPISTNEKRSVRFMARSPFRGTVLRTFERKSILRDAGTILSRSLDRDME